MKIQVNVKLKGERNEIIEKALVDTGAEISLMPLSMAKSIGAWHTNTQTSVVGVHGIAKTLPIIAVHLSFLSLKNIGGQFLFAMATPRPEDTLEPELIVGMDILKPLGIIVDTKTHRLSVKNEIWEAFKELTALGVIFFAGIKLFEALSKK